jgi:hypothetical protein
MIRVLFSWNNFHSYSIIILKINIISIFVLVNKNKINFIPNLSHFMKISQTAV